MQPAATGCEPKRPGTNTPCVFVCVLQDAKSERRKRLWFPSLGDRQIAAGHERIAPGLELLPAASSSAPVLGSKPRPTAQAIALRSYTAAASLLSHFKPETIPFFMNCAKAAVHRFDAASALRTDCSTCFRSAAASCRFCPSAMACSFRYSSCFAGVIASHSDFETFRG